MILVERPDTLLLDLQDVTAVNLAGIHALLNGYVAAIDHGTCYRVLHAHGQVRDVPQTTDTLEVLADSNDLGALLLAVGSAPAGRLPQYQARGRSRRAAGRCHCRGE